MSGRIPEQVVADVRERTDIVQVISQHVELRRAGANFKGLCPFHDEKTPSFNVNPQRQFYHCFGCQAHGDVIGFLMKIEGRSFVEVVEDLAARAGIEVPRATPEQARADARRRSERQQALDLNRQVADLYQQLLREPRGKACRDYLERRGLGEEICRVFQLGYAPSGGDVVVRLLERAGALQDGERLGLVAKRRGREGHHDRFWNRLIFPVLGAGGEVLGFGGRMLGDGDGPKYVNTPETALYRKGEALYGIHAAGKGMRQRGEALLVEGNVDVIQLHQAGFDNAVAPMGTALTPRQVALLRRFTAGVVALFDGDEAGRAAATKSVPVFVDGRLDAKVATLPPGQDPDSLLREQGGSALREVLDRARPAVQFVIDRQRAGMEDTVPGRARVVEQLAPLLARLPSRAEQDLYVDSVALQLGVQREVVARAVRGKGARDRAAIAAQIEKKPVIAKDFPAEEIDLVAILVEHPHLVARAEAAGISSLLTNDGVRATYRAAMQMQQATGHIEVADLLDAAPDAVRNGVADAVNLGAYASVSDPTRALDDCLGVLRRRRLEQERQEILERLTRAQERGDADAVRDLATRRLQVEREIHETR